METEVIFTHSQIDLTPATPPSREIGAMVEFHGIVRESEGPRVITGLRYEAYEPMARKQLQSHLRELSLAHSCTAVTIVHRIGFVPVGEISLLVRVFSKHRGPALALCEELIDRLKLDVPVWKM